jgi:signal transduction histidine kinase
MLSRPEDPALAFQTSISLKKLGFFDISIIVDALIAERERVISEQQAAVIRQSDERLRRAQRLESIGQLTVGIAHDFNNPLAVIVGNLEQLQVAVAADSDAAECQADALEAAFRGAELTRQLLAFAC